MGDLSCYLNAFITSSAGAIKDFVVHITSLKTRKIEHAIPNVNRHAATRLCDIGAVLGNRTTSARRLVA